MNVRKEEFYIYDLSWDGPFPVRYDRENDKYTINKDDIPEDLLGENGIYQIYGNHCVYGKDVLLYIGQTSSNDQNTQKRGFERRIDEHLKDRFYDHTNLSVYFGCFVDSDNNNYTPANEDVRLVEKVLIFSHIPALNKHEIDYKSNPDKTILVRNWYFKGSLQDVCTNAWDS